MLRSQARDMLLSKGKHPSIDTIRIELGNTGSKTTIHRYLKELELEESTCLDDEALLSNTLKELVVKLASQLHTEAQETIKKSGELHDLQIQEEQYKTGIFETKNVKLTEEIKNLKAELENTNNKSASLDNQHQAALAKNQRLDQKNIDLEALLKEKGRHIESLEEKHQHSREALEHYRSSVKDQRDQDLRRHEHQVQQLQVETRQLNQTLSVKQADITQLNKDNARLVTKLDTAQRELSDKTIEFRKINSDNQNSLQEISVLASTIEEKKRNESKLVSDLKKLESNLSLLDKLNQKKEIEIEKLKSELDVKNQIFDKLNIRTKHAQTDSTQPQADTKDRPN